MKLRFGIKNQTDERTNGRTNGDIEVLADARRALKKYDNNIIALKQQLLGINFYFFMHLKWPWLLRFFVEIQNHRKS